MTATEVAAVQALLQSNPDTLVIDVRTPAEFEGVHIPGAINLPLDQVDLHLERIVTDAGGQMVLVCQAGSRADQCQRKLAAAGLSATTVLSGGMNAWAAAGGAVVRGRQRWGLERQVRLAAGSIVALAVLVSVWWPPARFIAGMIGAGLAFAAVTNTCAMGMLLSRLPYNRPTYKVDIEASLAQLTGSRP
ncbi:rhodanese-like domain-containing protein [Catelliglobosispora koreensis]|uniref:rhodanese-like domain-containing protein n=1 Tax=Catelliglobosispora koreensis TaxID=129052 RepID=UPI0003731824|nr:rhodanese-like domain-containing protein [Catelliglobosispora koreensis]